MKKKLFQPANADIHKVIAVARVPELQMAASPVFDIPVNVHVAAALALCLMVHLRSDARCDCEECEFKNAAADVYAEMLFKAAQQSPGRFERPEDFAARMDKFVAECVLFTEDTDAAASARLAEVWGGSRSGGVQ